MSIPVLLVGIQHCYQFKVVDGSSPLETAQRQQFIMKMRELILKFRPTIIADESPDTDNAELLALYPQEASKICVDIPMEVKRDRHIHINRLLDGTLCPFVDTLRERYWQRQIFRHASRESGARTLMICGSLHVQRSAIKLVSFPDRLSRCGFLVQSIDLRKEPWWDESWLKEYWKRYIGSLSHLDGTPPEECCLRNWQRDGLDGQLPVCLRKHLRRDRNQGFTLEQLN
jgi:hypothetical protein